MFESTRLLELTYSDVWGPFLFFLSVTINITPHFWMVSIGLRGCLLYPQNLMHMQSLLNFNAMLSAYLTLK